MANRFFDYLYIFATIVLTVSGQFILKWRIAKFGIAPQGAEQKMGYITALLCDPLVLVGLGFGFGAALAWMLVVAKFDLSYAYPFTSLNYVLVLLASAVLFHEAITVPKAAGVALIVVGTVLIARG